MNQLMTLSEGGGLKGGVEGSAESYARMLAGRDPRHRAALARSSPVIMDALREMFPQYGAMGEEEGLMPALTSGKIGTKDVAEAVRRAALNPRVVQRADEAKNVDTSGPFSAQNFRSTYRGIMQWGSDPGGAFKDWVTTMPGTARNSPSVTTLPGMGDVGNESWQAHPEPGRRAGEYQFTSLAGLAEKMQQEASGAGGDPAVEQVSLLKQIAENTKKGDGPIVPKHEHPQQQYWH
jgi:hypothetical protein